MVGSPVAVRVGTEPAISSVGSDAARFDALYGETVARVTAYVRARVAADDVEDVVAQTYLTAWRRLDEVPVRPLPWLLVTARNTASQTSRANGRRDALVAEVERLHHLSVAVDRDVAEQVSERLTVLAALAALGPGDQEVLMLTAWDGLAAREVGRLLGCSAAVAAVRSHRARRRLASAITARESDPTAPPAPRPMPFRASRGLSEPVTTPDQPGRSA